ncbi:hypothetical protein PVK06_034529 [Gossypium arboreum]|uniref:Uncharacterized protein n=1 Tax=Gossypium arboreum TaxID=29729 RepID=A0ABR0NFE9_GOSAR|nr:hypothetical protein PVK06_034529 [Gossypium arboreum]
MIYRPSSSSSTFPTTYPIAPNLNPEFPPEVMTLIEQGTFHSKTKDMMFEYQIQVFKNFSGPILRPWGVHPDYPFIQPIKFEFIEQPDEYYQENKENYMVIIFYKLQYFVTRERAIQLGSFPTTWIHKVLDEEDIRKHDVQYRIIQKFLCQLNKVIPFEVWPPLEIDAPWDTWPIRYKPYHIEIIKAIQDYYESIPNPSEWSQEYPLYYSQINLLKLHQEQDDDGNKDMDEDKNSGSSDFEEPDMTANSDDTMDSA